MEKQTNNNGVIALLIVIIIIISILCVLFATGTITLKTNDANNNANQNVTDNNNNSNTNTNDLYHFGDDLILNSLSNINYSSIGFPNEHGDFSQWKVLKDEGEYITLYYAGSELLYGKEDRDYTISKYKERKILFTSNGIDFGTNGEIRILNENDLILLGCNFETLTCSNSPDWISGWTSYSQNNYKYTINSGKLNPIEQDSPVAAFAKPIIKILKSNIK